MGRFWRNLRGKSQHARARQSRDFEHALELLEPRRLLSVIAPTIMQAYVIYKEAPDGATARAHLQWGDNNTTETGYRVEWSPDGVSNWAPIGADLPANTSTATQTLDAGQKEYFRISALQNGFVSAPSAVFTCSMPIDRVVQVTASARASTVTLSWPANSNAISYNVYRKARTDTTWTLLTLRALPARSTGYVDSVATGSAYEYEVQRSMHNYYYGADGVAIGYVYAGNQLSVVESPGRVLLVVDQTQASAIASSLTTYRRDLIDDGWNVDQILVPRDNGDAHLATTVKALIQADAAAHIGGLQSIVLIGHVPVPYSGATAWDNHSDHVGAWPADAYYGEAIGVAEPIPWTDSQTILNPTYPDNNNLPGDGKFDQDYLPDPVNVPVGRIDFANLPGMRYTFSPAPATDDLAEPLMIERYLQKDHLWRTGQVDVPNRAIEDDELGGSEAENGWRNFAPLVGAANTTSADWQVQLNGQSDLWSSGLGPGAADNAVNVVSTLQLHSTSSQVTSVFNMLYGSYFGDWNKSGDLMREIIASQGTSLVSMWVGAPNWFVQTMGLGETIGQATMLTQNNSQAGPYTPVSSAMQSAPIALMGDPTLTMSIAKPVTNFSLSATAKTNTLTWSAPANQLVSSYYVYRAASPDGPFTRLAIVPAPDDGSTPQFVDSFTARVTYTYMVRAMSLQLTPSGSYWNMSNGVTIQSPGAGFNGVVTANPINGISQSPNDSGSGDGDGDGGDIIDQLTGGGSDGDSGPLT